MRINSIFAQNVQPTRLVHVEGLSDVVVFAGPNGVGKTRFVNGLIRFFQNPAANQNLWMQIEATSSSERTEWGKAQLDTRQPSDASLLRATLQKQRPRNHQESGVLNFDSDRAIIQIQPYQFTWDYTNPFLELVDWSMGLTSLRNRFQDTVNSIFRMVRSRREAMAKEMERLIERHAQSSAGGQVGVREDDIPKGVYFNPEEFPDPLIPFYNAFSQLLAPKRLVVPDPKKSTLHFTDGAEERSMNDLSSGEREVVNVVFDFLLRNPSDCIVIFDEPELHLHPELSYKLIQTLKSAGARNQFIFCTHSADIISASLDNSVVFISPPKPDGSNQAVQVSEDDTTHQALKLLGQSVGIVSLGRKIVLIEGDHGSLDKQTYGTILKGRFPNLALVPSGGKGLIRSFETLRREVLDKAVWGVDFFMLCDRDAIPSIADVSSLESESYGRLRVLKRYHLENYFLDESVIAEVFASMEPSESWLRSPTQVEQRLKLIAREYLSYSVALSASAFFCERVGSLDIMPKGCHGKSVEELVTLFSEKSIAERARIDSALQASAIEAHIRGLMDRLTGSLNDGSDTWKRDVPGRVILQVFCSTKHANIDFGRFKLAYLVAAAARPTGPFGEIEDIFLSFSEYAD